jgi:branched-chain amino acid transport system substrate-binding protein
MTPNTRAAGWTATVCLAALALLAGCGDDSGEGEAAAGGGLPDTVTVGSLNSMTGPAAFCGQLQVQGAELAIAEAAETNFLGDTNVELQVVDDKSALETAVSGFRELADAGVAAIVGPCNGTVGTAVTPLAQQSEIPQVVTTASAADVSGSYVFRAGIPQSEYADNAIRVLADRGVKRVAAIYDQSQASIADPIWRDTQRVAIEEAGMELVAEVPVTAEVTDFSSQVAEIMRAEPEAVGILLQGPPNLTVANQLREAGFKGTLWGHQSTLLDFYIDGGEAVEGTVVSASYATNLPYESSKNFTQRFEDEYGEEPRELAAHGYDAMWMTLRALEAAGSTDPAAVQEALAGIREMDGAQGPITFTDQGDARGEATAVEIERGELVGVDGGR